MIRLNVRNANSELREPPQRPALQSCKSTGHTLQLQPLSRFADIAAGSQHRRYRRTFTTRTLTLRSRRCRQSRAWAFAIICAISSNRLLFEACRAFSSRAIECCELSGRLLWRAAPRCSCTSSAVSSVSIYATSFLRSPRRTSGHTRWATTVRQATWLQMNW